MSSGIDAIYDSIFSEISTLEDMLVQLRYNCSCDDEDQKAKIKYLEDKKSELYQLYHLVYRDSSTTILDKLKAIDADVRNTAQISRVVA